MATHVHAPQDVGTFHNTIGPQMWKELGDPSTASAQLREYIFMKMRDPNSATGANSALMPRGLGDQYCDEEQFGLKSKERDNSLRFFSLTRTQYALLAQWKDGKFVADGDRPAKFPALRQPITPEGLDRAVLEAQTAGAQLIIGLATGMLPTTNGWSVKLCGAAAQRLDADFLITAVGRAGSISSTQGQRIRLDALCLVGGFTLPTSPLENAMLVEAIPGGWWYSAPSPDNQIFAAWMTDVGVLPSGRQLGHAMAKALLDAPFTRGRLAVPPVARSIAATSAVLRPCAGIGWVAVGDAALARDPLSGQGLACALRSGWDGAQTLLAALGGDKDAWTNAAARGERATTVYLNECAAKYRAQPRWPDAPFWSARRRLSTAPISKLNGSIG